MIDAGGARAPAADGVEAERAYPTQLRCKMNQSTSR